MFAVAQLPLGPVVNPLQGVNGIDRFGVVLQEMLVGLEFDLDTFQHPLGMYGPRADQADEFPGPGQRGPDAGRLGQTGLAAPARHSQSKQTAMQDRLFNLADYLEVIVRPGQMEHGRKIRLAEVAEISGGLFLSLRIYYLRNITDVPTDGRKFRTASPGPFFDCFIIFRRTFRCMAQ